MIRALQLGTIRMYVDDSNVMGQMYIGNGLNYEPHIRAELEKWIPSSIGFADIGSNQGIHVVSAKTIKRDVPVIAADCNAKNCELLSRTLAENDLQDVVLLSCTLAERPKVVLNNLDPSNTSCLCLDGKNSQDYPRYVFALNLDAFDLFPVDLIKIDVEGFEIRVLNGASKMLKNKPRILFEFCPALAYRSNVSPTEMLTWFYDRGYQLTVLDYLRNGNRKVCATPNAVMQHMHEMSMAITDIIAEFA